MDKFFYFGPNGALHIFGIKLVGFDATNGHKLLFTIGLLIALYVLGKLLRALGYMLPRKYERGVFWYRQGVHVFTAIVLVVGVLSIWFDDPTRLTTAMGLFTAGLAFALQRVVTALAGYLLILRGDTFNVGDRIVMGGVRGDVIALGFLQTTIMEMGQPPPVQNADPAMWVKSRQYTGRIVTVSNAQVFDEPVYNYTRDFPYIWEEITVPIAYRDDRAKAEQILLEAAQKHTVQITELSEDAIVELERRFAMKRPQIRPKVYLRLTDNWIELTVRFLAKDHAIRDLKDAMSRDILAGLEAVKIGIASSTFEIVGLPKVEIEAELPAR